MDELPHYEKMAEWERLANTGWINMTVEDLKDTLEALRELLVRDGQWAEKWKAALDLIDGPVAELAAERERADRTEAERADRLEAALRFIQEMAAEDLRIGHNISTWQIEAEASTGRAD